MAGTGRTDEAHVVHSLEAAPRDEQRRRGALATPMKAILTYHSIDGSGSPVSIDPAAFRAHVDWLAGSGLPIVRPARLLELPEDVAAAALTFDDGFANFATHAWPLLREHGWPVTLYVAPAWVGRTNTWSGGGPAGIPELPLLGWEELGRMAEEGLELGAHSDTHPDLRSIPDARIEDEVAGSAEQIAARTGSRPDSFAYPFGVSDQRVVHAVRSSFDTACTTELRELRHGEDRHRLPRLDAYYLRRADGLERWGTRSFRRYIALRNQLRRARSILTKGSGREEE